MMAEKRLTLGVALIIFDVASTLNHSFANVGTRFHRQVGLQFASQRRWIMKLALIALGLLATTGVVYAACVFC